MEDIEDMKDDKGKLRYDIVPPEFYEWIAEVMTHGAEKYAVDSWRTLENGKERFLGAVFRHYVAWRKGEAIDADSGNHHLKHAIVSMMIALYLDGGYDEKA